VTDSKTPENGRPAVRAISPDETARAIATITLAFAADPMARWSMPDPDTYLANFPLLARAFAGNAFAAGDAHVAGAAHVAGDFAGVAVWLAPGSESDGDALVAIMEKVMTPAQFAEGGAVFEQMADFHPQEPHWYLPLIGVDPARQGQGLGGALMRHALAECDRTATPAYLESSNPANVPFYRQHGFTLLGEIQAGSSPVMYPMLREPRAPF